MPRSFSRSQIDKLGRRLAAGGPVAPDDEAMLAQLLRDYRVVLEAVEPLVHRASGATTTGRVKTIGTLVDKLRRGTRLSAVQDVAGIRVVVGGSRRE